MNQQGPLRWIDGAGWLIFAGGADSDIRAQALGRAEADGVVAYVSLADDRGDALMDDMEDLGAPTGYLVDFVADRGETLKEHLTEASIIVLETGSSLNVMMQTLSDSAIAALRDAYERGAVLLIEGLAINGFGRWWITDDGDVYNGLSWLENVFLEPSAAIADDSVMVQDVLRAYAEAITIEISEESALVLGGTGRVELWGKQQVKISLGRQYTG